MLMPWLTRKFYTLFNMLFVMTESLETSSRPSMWRNTLILFLLDFVQMTRVLTAPVFGWSKQTTDLIHNFDPIYVATSLASNVVPRYSFFILAFFIVTAALAESGYVARLFEDGNVQKMWPVKVLRYLVLAIVTTLFSSIMEWLLIPLMCLASDEYNFSEAIHGDGEDCHPFQFPEVMASVPTILISVFYIMFALTASFFSLQANILSCTPQSSSSGRVEAMFLASKVAASCLVFLSHQLLPTGVAAINFIFCLAVFYNHIILLPFNFYHTNCLRGGIYGGVTWTAMSSIIVSRVEGQPLQWTLAAMIPVSFLSGMVIVHLAKNRITQNLDRLRGEFDNQQQAEVGTGKSALATAAKKRANDQFFDPTWERKRAFTSGPHALTCARVLLYKRSRDNVSFLNYVVDRGIQEFPRYQPLQILRLLLLELVFEETVKAGAERKKLKAHQDAIPWDLRFVLYSIERKAVQDSAAQNLGKDGQITAINLMEFNIGLERAKKAHLQALAEIKHLWQIVVRNIKKKNKDLKPQIEEIVKRLEEYRRLSSEAEKEYHMLLYKYPTSVELLYAYANFADCVLNDFVDAEAKRTQAASLQDDPVEETASQLEEIEKEKAGGEKSVHSSSVSSENKRVQIRRTFMSWRDRIMGEELRDLLRLATRIRFSLMLVLALATSAFVISDFMLFKSMAKKEMHMIATIADMRTTITHGTHLLRTAVLRAWQRDDEGLHQVQEEGKHVAQDFLYHHNFVYFSVDFAEASHFYNDKQFHAIVPESGRWVNETSNLWQLGSEFGRRMDLAFSATKEELSDPDYALTAMSEEKRNILYVFENLFPALITAIDGVEHVYIHEMDVIQHSTDLLVAINSSLNAALICMICGIFMFSLRRVVHVLEYRRCITLMAVAVPLETATKLHKFYKEAEQNLKMIEDEEAERKQLMEQTDLPFKPDRRLSSDSVGRTGSFAVPRQLDRRESHLSSTEDVSNAVVLPLTSSNLKDWALKAKERTGKNCIHKGDDGSGVIPNRTASGASHDSVGKEAAGSASFEFGLLNGASTPPGMSMCIMQGTASETILMVRTEDENELATAAEHQSKSHCEFQASVVPIERKVSQSSDGTQQDEGDVVVHSVWTKAGSSCEASVPTTKPDKDQSVDRSNRLQGSYSNLHTVHSEEELDVMDKIESPTFDLKNLSGRSSPATAHGRPRPFSPPPKLSPAIGTAVKEDQPEVKDGDIVREESALKTEQDADVARSSFRARHLEGNSKVSTEVAPSEPFSFDGSFNRMKKKLLRFSNSFGAKGSALKKLPSIKLEKDQDPLNRLDSGAPAPVRRNSTIDFLENVWEDETVANSANLLNDLLGARRRWHSRMSVYGVTFAILFFLSVMSTVFPARHLSQLIPLAPIVNEAGRREEITKSIVMFSRELILDDGLTRKNKQEISNALRFLIEEHKATDEAIRLGHAHGIGTGADHRNEEHNRIMYEGYCPWTYDHECHVDEKPAANGRGLLYLSKTVMDSAKSVLLRYGLPEQEHSDPHTTPALMRYHQDWQNPHRFEEVEISEERYHILDDDVDMKLLMHSFDGELVHGYRYIEHVFDEEMDLFLERAIHENDLLFSVYVVSIILGFYVLLFRRTLKHAKNEVQAAQEFALQVPAHILSQPEAEFLQRCLCNDLDRRMDVDPEP